MMRMTTLFVGIAMAWGFGALPAAAQPDTGPIDPAFRVLDSNEVLFLHTAGNVSTYQEVYDLDGAADEVGTMIPQLSRIGLANSSGNRRIDAAVGDFNGDFEPEWASAWESGTRDVRVSMPLFNGSGGADQEAVSFVLQANGFGDLSPLATVSAPYLDYTLHPREIRMAAGDLDADGDDELIVGYRRGDLVQLAVFGVASDQIAVTERVVRTVRTFRVNNAVTSRCGYSSDDIIPPGGQVFDLVVGNFRGDEREELAMAFVDHPAPGCELTTEQRATVEIFGLSDDATALDSLAREVVGDQQAVVQTGLFPSPFDAGTFISRVAIAPGDIDQNGFDELVMAQVVQNVAGAPVVDVFAHLLTVLPGLGVSGDTIAVDAIGMFDTQNRKDGGPFDVAVGDIDGDAVFEVVYAGLPSVRVFRLDSTPSLVPVDAVPLTSSAFNQSHRVLTVSDVDTNESTLFSPELVVADALGSSPGDLVVYHLERDLLVEKTRDATLGFGSEKDIVALLPINTDGDGAALGVPEVHSRRDVLNPLVYLSTPPVHFDTFGRNPEDGTCYTQTGPISWVIHEDCVDLSVCFNPRITDPQSLIECNFLSSYTETLGSTIDATSKVTNAWSASAALTGKYKKETPFFKNEVSLKISGGYGQKFSKKNGNSMTTSLEKTKITFGNGDDWIYALKADYDVYEYPVLGGLGQPIGYVVAVEPRGTPIHQWFNATSLTETERVQIFPSHEPSNLLSYTPLSDFDFNAEEPLRALPDFQSRIFFDEAQTQWQITETPSNDKLTLTFSETNFETKSAKSSWFVGAELNVVGEAGVKARPFVGATVSLGLNVKGRYDSSSLSTTTNTVVEGGEINVDMGYLDGQVVLFGQGVGSVAYTVAPMIYWSEGGTMIIDWAVDLPQGPASFWSNSYGNLPDLSFISPWRHDLAKEKRSLNSPTLRPFLIRSPDIIVDPVAPIPGEPAFIKARVQNFSLTTSPATFVNFYLGDPLSGGTLIGSANVDAIPPQGDFVAVYENWIVPQGLTATDRIYAWVDPNDDYAEIHEENNLVWNTTSRFVVPEAGASAAALALLAGLSLLTRRRARGQVPRA